MIETHGVTHLALRVRDPVRAFSFYREVFGMVEVYRGDTYVQAQTPGSWDAIVFERSDSVEHRSGGILHFGFRLTRPENTSALAGVIERAGGTILDQGEFGPGEPYVFFLDPGGYEVEIWHERPTPFDPVDTSRVPEAEGTEP